MKKITYKNLENIACYFMQYTDKFFANIIDFLRKMCYYSMRLEITNPFALYPSFCAENQC